MNQILSVDMHEGKTKGKKVGINPILRFFSIFLIILGLGAILSGVIIKNNSKNASISNHNQLSSTTSEVGPSIEIIQGVSKLDVTVSSDLGIEKVVYKWSNGDEVQINGGNGEGKNEVTFDTTIPLGNNIFNIVATDLEGNEKILESQYVGVEQYEPEIQLSQDAFSLKWAVTSEKNIKNISYTWDNEEAVNIDVNNLNAEFQIDIKRTNEEGRTEYLQGKHQISIVVTNEDDEKYEDVRAVYLPTIDVLVDQEKYIINAQDERGITKVKININGVEKEIELSDSTGEENSSADVEEGDTNQTGVKNYSSEGREEEQLLRLLDTDNELIVTVYNVDGLSAIRMMRYTR